MKDAPAVRQKLKQVLARHLQKRLKEVLKRRPRTCLHNHAFDLGRPGDEVGMCFYILKGKPRGIPCDERVKTLMGNGIQQAKSCPYWEACRGKEDIRAEFKSLLASRNLAVIAAELPDAAALLWVLGDDTDLKDVEGLLEEENE